MPSLQRQFNLPTDFTLHLCHSVCLVAHLWSFIRIVCPTQFHFAFVAHSAEPVGLVLSLVMLFRILSCSLTSSVFLSIAHRLASSFFTNTVIRDYVLHTYVITGRTHWLNTCHFTPMGRCLSKQIFSVLYKHAPS